MKFLLILFIFLISTLSSVTSAESEDTSYSLLDYQNEEMVRDTMMVIQFSTDPPRRVRRQIEPSDLEAHSYSDYGRPYDSTQHLNPKLSALITGVFFLFVLYVTFRVWRSIKKEERNERKNKSPL